ncbi:MAG: PepSY-associated TM helix domain-containing protein [Bacteroidota bacterium]|nr:PepSY-associated TM helix domain-containing protein [Bacteroidota bacterium]
MGTSTRGNGNGNTVKVIRKIHRITASFLSVALLIVAVSGILLGWKKNSNGYLHPVSYTGTTTDLSQWLPLDSLNAIAIRTLHETGRKGLSEDLDRIDIRPDKGMVKFVFAHHYHGIQLDGATGRVLSIENRRSDLVEDIHDMSFVDHILGIDGEIFKLIYTSFTGLSLLVFTVTGIWLRYRPRAGGSKGSGTI